MARIKIEDIVEHLDYELKRALEAAARDAIPDAEIDRQRLFKAFVKQVRKKCSTWETVPDHTVDR